MRTKYVLPTVLLLAGCGAGEVVGTSSPPPPVVMLHERPDAPAAACTGLDTARPPAGAEAERRQAMPDLRLTCLDDGPGLNLQALRGPAVVNVWASWCRPCAQEMPHLVAVEAAVRDKVRFVGLNISDDPADARTWNAYHQVGWPSLRDPDGGIRGPMRVPGPPVTFFVRSDGGIAGVHYGAFTSTDQVREALAEHLGVGSGTSSEAAERARRARDE